MHSKFYVWLFNRTIFLELLQLTPGRQVNLQIVRAEACLALFFYEIEILIAASVECPSLIVEVVSCYEISRARISLLRFASPAHKTVTSMPLMSKNGVSGQIMASVEFSHVSVSHFRENSRAVEPRLA